MSTEVAVGQNRWLPLLYLCRTPESLKFRTQLNNGFELVKIWLTTPSSGDSRNANYQLATVPVGDANL